MRIDDSSLVVEVPKWGAVFDEIIIDPDNLAIMSEGARKLDNRQIATFKRRWWKCQYVLTGNMSWWNRLRGLHKGLPLYNRYDEAMERYEAIRNRYKELQSDAQDKRIRYQMQRLKGKALGYAEYIEAARQWMVAQRQIEARFKEHHEAVRFERQLKADRKQMQREVKYFAQKIIERWSQLGYKDEWEEKGRWIVNKVRFEKSIATEDEIHLKILASKVTRLGSNKVVLPEKVRVYDLVKPETLRELEAACERPIYSPHNPIDYSQGVGFDSGGWLVLCRVDHRGGLRDYISLKTQLAHYPHQKNRDGDLALPMGLKRGRKLNWGFISNSTPHFMFNGITGSGKTNAMVGCLTVLIQKHPPSDVRLVITDLKRGGNFRDFKSVPHNLLQEIIHSTEKLKQTLEMILQVMYRRQATIGAIANDIGEYNRMVDPDERLARVLILIDEYSETRQMMDDASVKHTIDSIVDAIARLGRAAGIHLMIGNQQPMAANMTAEMRGNIPYVLTGYQRTLGASFATMGDKSARELKNHPGRMLVDNGKDRFEVQLPHCNQDDIEAAVKAAAEWTTPSKFDYPAGLDVSNEEIIESMQPKPFTEHELIQTAIEQFDGIISTRKIFDAVRYEFDISHRQIEKLRDVVVSQDEWDYDGNTYNVTPYGKGYQLVKHENTQNTDGISVDNRDLPRVYDSSVFLNDGGEDDETIS